MGRTSTTTERLFETTKGAAETMLETTAEAQEQGWRFLDEMQQQARRATTANLASARVLTEAAFDFALAWNGLLLSAIAIPFSFATHSRQFGVVSEERAGPKKQQAA